MVAQKITITLDRDQVAQIHGLVEAGQAASVSGFVKHAVGVALLDAAGWKEVLDEALLKTGGPLTEHERAWADGVLSPVRSRKSRRSRKAA